MSRKTITTRIRKAETTERRKELLGVWYQHWQNEQWTLIEKMDLAIDIRDFDQLCMCVGALREISKKKFNVLDNCLPILAANENFCNDEEFWISRWKRFQTDIIAILGSHVAHQDYTEIRKASDKLLDNHKKCFEQLKKTIESF